MLSGSNNKIKLENCFKKFSKKIFIITENNKKISYEDFFFKVLQLINYFHNKKLKKNARILILGDNNINYLIIHAACLFGGYVSCPIDPIIKPERLKDLKKIYKIDFTINNTNKLFFSNLSLDKSLINYKNSDCLIIPSYDKDGKLQGILLNSDTIIKKAKSFSELSKFNKNSNIFHCLPMFYMAGILDTFFSCIFSGSTITLGKRFSVLQIKKFWEISIKNNCNILFLTPSILTFICSIYRTPTYIIKQHVKKCKSIIATGDYLYKETRVKFYKIFKKKIFALYGLTELGGPITLECNKNKLIDFSAGKSSKEIKIKINKSKGNIILIKSPYLMSGYITKTGLKKPILENGFYNTGDIGYLVKNNLFVTGRKRKITKKGGELISLSLIEKISLDYKNIKKAQTFVKKNLIAGEEIFLKIEFKKKINTEKNIEKFKKFLTRKLRSIEIPREIIF